MSKTKETIIDVKVGDITKKFANEKVILIGVYPSSDSGFAEDLSIVVNENDGPAITTKTPYSGYNLDLFLADLNGDGKDEILLYGDYGGSGGYTIGAVYTYSEDISKVPKELYEIFNPSMFVEKYPLTAAYTTDKKVVVTSEKKKEQYIFDISKKDKFILDLIYDKNGNVNDFQAPSVSDPNNVFPVRIGKEYFLLIRQRIVGVSNSDTIGYVENYVSLKNNDISLIQSGAYNFGTNVSINELPLGAIVINPKSLGYPKDKIMLDLDSGKAFDNIILYTLSGIPFVTISHSKTKGKESIKNATVEGVGYNFDFIKPVKIKGKTYIFVGYKIGGKVNALNIYTYEDNKLVPLLKNNEFTYSKIYIEDIKNNKTIQVILWIQDTGESYDIHIYDFVDDKLSETSMYDNIYYKKVISHYKNQLKLYKNSPTYLYYLALAYLKVDNKQDACKAINAALKTKYPYPSIDKLEKLKFSTKCKY